MLTFFTVNPFTALLFFLPVIVFSMIFMHPLYVVLNVCLSFGACMVLARKETIAGIKFILGFGAVIALVNPLFNTGGETVLFTYFGRPYTLQALVYGFVMAGILISCINWFSCMGRVLTNDKFIYIMGGRLPKLCTMLSMVTGLVPFFQSKLVEISRVQSVNLKSDSNVRSAFRALSTATSYAFEHRINMSVSMKNRAFGTGVNTRYARYRIRTADMVLMIIIALLTAVTTVFCLSPATSAQIIPQIIFAPVDTRQAVGIACYVLLLMMPVITTVIEEIQWQYLKSKI